MKQIYFQINDGPEQEFLKIENNVQTILQIQNVETTGEGTLYYIVFRDSEGNEFKLYAKN